MSRVLVDSGIGYLENIPNNWNIFRIKNAFECEKNIVNDNWSNTQLLSLTTSGVKEKDIDNPNGKLPDSFDGYQYVEKNNIIMCLFDLDCSAVFSGISKYNGMISPAYKVLECKEMMNPDYAGYYFNYISFDRKYMHYSKNIRYTLNYDEFSSLPMLIPPLEEQKRIASYLDKQCKKIDQIITDNNSEINLLVEYKKNEVNNMISNYSYKNTKIKYLLDKLNIKTGPFGSTLTGKTIDYSDYCVYSQANLISNDFTKTKNYISKEVYDTLISYYAYPNDILLSMMGTIGKCKIIPNGIKKGIIDSHIIKISLNEKIINPKYFEIIYDKDSSNIVFNQLLYESKGSIMDGLNTTIVKNLKIPLMNLDSQKDFLEKYHDFSNKIDQVIDYRKQIIEKLEEYKKSLIYECVTGKREV